MKKTGEKEYKTTKNRGLVEKTNPICERVK